MVCKGGKTMPLELQLLNVQQIASIIGLIGYVLLLISTQQSKQIEIERLSGIESNPSNLNPDRIAADSSWTRFTAIFLLTTVAIIRLRQRLEEQQAGEQTPSLEPIKNITLGGIFSTIGALILSIGSQQRAEEGEPRVSII
jgi:hypothetical protein